jgi:hypothetical protein
MHFFVARRKYSLISTTKPATTSTTEPATGRAISTAGITTAEVLLTTDRHNHHHRNYIHYIMYCTYLTTPST